MFTARRLRATCALLAAGLATQVLLLATLLGAGWWALDGDAAPVQDTPLAGPLAQVGSYAVAGAAFNHRPLRLFPAAAAPATPTAPTAPGGHAAGGGQQSQPGGALMQPERIAGTTDASQTSVAAGSRIVGALVCAAGLALLLAAVLTWRLARLWAGAADLRTPQRLAPTQQQPC